MKLTLNSGLTALGAVLLGLAAEAQQPSTTADHGGNGSTQTYPQGAPALRPDSLNNPNSTTNLGGKPNMTRKERRALRKSRSTNRVERRSSTSQNARMNQGDANTTTYPMEGNAATTQPDLGTPMKSTPATGTGSSNAGNQNGNTGINTMGTATAGYTDTTSTTTNARSGNGSTSNASMGTGTASSNAGNQNGNTGINPQGTSTSGYTGTTAHSGSNRTNTGNSGAMAGSAASMSKMSIADFTSASPDYTTLVNALQTSDMVDKLQGAGQFTVFAPSNSAFNKLPAKTRNTLLNGQNRETLKQLMGYHMVEGVLDSKEIARRMNAGNGKTTLQTMTGGTLVVEMGTNGRLKITDDQGGVAYVDGPDHFQSNGVVHGVDKVLLPQGIMARFK